MTTKLFSALLPDVLPHVPGCSDIWAETELARSAELFFRETLAWRDCVSVWTHPQQGEYDLEVPAESRLAEIIEVTYRGFPIPPVTELQASRKYGSWRETTGDGVKSYLRTAPQTIRLYPIPETAEQDAVKVYAALYPARNASGMDSDTLDRWEEAVVDGALARLLAKPAQRWTDLVMAGYHSQRFEHFISRGRAESAKNGTRAPQRAQMRPLA